MQQNALFCLTISKTLTTSQVLQKMGGIKKIHTTAAEKGEHGVIEFPLGASIVNRLLNKTQKLEKFLVVNVVSATESIHGTCISKFYVNSNIMNFYNFSCI